MDLGGRGSAAGFEEVPLLFANNSCAQPQEPLLLYLAATNQVASAALVAQREFEEEAAAAAKPSDDGPEHSLVGPDAGKAEPLAKPGPGKTESA